VNVEPYVSKRPEETLGLASLQRRSSNGNDGFKIVLLAEKFRIHSDSSVSDSSAFFFGNRLSPWSRSRAKRIFDCVCVVSMLSLIIPSLLLIGLAVRLTSQGPVLFLQQRMGRRGRSFTILKFRTMIHDSDRAHHPVTTSGNQLFTPVGPFLRRWKLDELPQLLNVLAGHMSLVGPRPKLPAHAISNLPCRCGVTGAATVAFASEEEVLDRVPKHHLDSFYHSVVLPAKHRLDAEYMARATFLSDLKMIFDSVFRRWDTSTVEDLLNNWAFEQRGGRVLPSVADLDPATLHVPIAAHMDRPASSGQIPAF